MRTYIFSVVCVAALGGCVITLAPEGIRSGIKKHIKLISSLCLLCVMISPMSELLTSLGEIGDSVASDDDREELQSMYESIYNGEMDKENGEGIGAAVKEKLYERFDIPGGESRVEVSFRDLDGDGFREPTRITVILSGGSVFRDPRKIEDYLSELFGAECVCAIELS